MGIKKIMVDEELISKVVELNALAQENVPKKKA